jgi:ribosome-binding ATPase YchF (GTP1/OBG family)
VVEVPDPRLQQLAEIIQPERIVPAIVEFVDIAGLVAGRQQGRRPGQPVPGHIRETDAIVNVVRCFEDDNVIHVAGKVDPISDIEVIQTELCLADLARWKRACNRYTKAAKSGNDKEAAKLVALLTRMPGRAQRRQARAHGGSQQGRAAPAQAAVPDHRQARHVRRQRERRRL